MCEISTCFLNLSTLARVTPVLLVKPSRLKCRSTGALATRCMRQDSVRLEVDYRRHSFLKELHRIIVCVGIFEEHGDSNGSVETCCKRVSILVNEYQDSPTNIPIGRSRVTVFDNREIHIP
jgi:hypothetical protein